MNKLQEFTPVFTEELPYKKDMEFGKIYISREHEVACFLCPCGCGEVNHISFIKIRERLLSGHPLAVSSLLAKVISSSRKIILTGYDKEKIDNQVK